VQSRESMKEQLIDISDTDMFMSEIYTDCMLRIILEVGDGWNASHGMCGL
jgi:hypothetical protein